MKCYYTSVQETEVFWVAEHLGQKVNDQRSGRVEFGEHGERLSGGPKYVVANHSGPQKGEMRS